MNRDFEFRQLLRAYRAGIITEKAFEAEMAEDRAGQRGERRRRRLSRVRQDLQVRARSDRELPRQRPRAAEANGALTFGNWAKVCTTDCIRSGLRMIAEREGYHARIFENRLRELGAEPRAKASAESVKVKRVRVGPEDDG
jgi:hypothetical protein